MIDGSAEARRCAARKPRNLRVTELNCARSAMAAKPLALASASNIGETIRNYRLGKGMSQGDIEKRTGLLRCYLSRVENGHTIPSLDTLSKIAGAMELPLSQFFAESGHSNGAKGLPQLSDDEVRFLSQIRRYSVSLNDSDRKLVLAMVKKMASNAK